MVFCVGVPYLSWNWQTLEHVEHTVQAGSSIVPLRDSLSELFFHVIRGLFVDGKQETGLPDHVINNFLKSFERESLCINHFLYWLNWLAWFDKMKKKAAQDRNKTTCALIKNK